MHRIIICLVVLLRCAPAPAQEAARLVPIADGYARTSVNAVIFRRNSVVSHEGFQYVAFYDAHANVILAKRALGSTDWEVTQTDYTGKVADAHNSISIMVDGAGVLHMSWDHHANPLRYCRGVAPGSLELTGKLPMTGKNENRVTYPEFYRLPDGDLLFAYRDGSSGRGDLMLNHYDVESQTWSQRQAAFIDGEGERNAYWQMCTDDRGVIHLSWVWRETGDVATNHDLCYAKSLDQGRTWLRSTGEAYTLPITAASAEYVARIPQNSDLINTTSICADREGRPYFATYWTPAGERVPQYHLVRHDGERWRIDRIGNRTSEFHLSGAGTKRSPISRCQILIDDSGDADLVYVIFRDTERGDRVTLAACEDLDAGRWRLEDLTDFPVNRWEPTYDTELWRNNKQLHLFLQPVGQGDGERVEDVPPQTVSILEWTPG